MRVLYSNNPRVCVRVLDMGNNGKDIGDGGRGDVIMAGPNGDITAEGDITKLSDGFVLTVSS